jgi:hypothetical protein
MLKKLLIGLIAFMTMFSNVAMVHGYSGTETKKSVTGKSLPIGKSEQKSSIGKNGFPNGNDFVRSSADKGNSQPAVKTNTIVLKFKDISDVGKLGITEKIVGKYDNSARCRSRQNHREI